MRSIALLVEVVVVYLALLLLNEILKEMLN